MLASADKPRAGAGECKAGEHKLKLARAEVELASPKPRELASCSMHSSSMSHTPAAECTTHSAVFYAMGCVITFAGVLYGLITRMFTI